MDGKPWKQMYWGTATVQQQGDEMVYLQRDTTVAFSLPPPRNNSAATMLPVSCRGTKRTIYFLLINVRIYILTFPMLMVTADSTCLLLGVKPLLPSTDVEGSQVLVRKHARFHEKAPCGEVIIRQPDGRPVPHREGRKSGYRSSSMSVIGSSVIRHGEVVMQMLHVSTFLSTPASFFFLAALFKYIHPAVLRAAR